MNSVRSCVELSLRTKNIIYCQEIHELIPLGLGECSFNILYFTQQVLFPQAAQESFCPDIDNFGEESVNNLIQIMITVC